MAEEKRYKIVYCTPALYMAGGVERVLTLKANYFAEYFGYDVTIILTEGNHNPYFYPLSDKVKVINLDINYEELWTYSFIKKVYVYLKKQRIYKKKLTMELMRIRPDITISLLRREINFINDIKDGSKKIGELHVNRSNYRNFESNDINIFKFVISKIWMNSLVNKLIKLDTFVVLTEEDKLQWGELNNVIVIPDFLPFLPKTVSPLKTKRVIAVGRYVYQKGFDLLLQAWSIVENRCFDWELVVFGQGDRIPYESMIDALGLDRSRCHLNGRTDDIEKEYCNSSIFVLSSRFEGFGMVLIEAMACGLPVVSFDCPCGPKDIINNNVNGILVKSGDVESLSQSIVELITNTKLRKRMSHNALETVLRYNQNVIANKWKVLFDGLLECNNYLVDEL